jgi:hypothetical protein
MNKKVHDNYFIFFVIGVVLIFAATFVFGVDAASSGWTKACFGTVKVKPVSANKVKVICSGGDGSKVDSSIRSESGYPPPEPEWPYQPPPDYSNETPIPMPPLPTLAPTMDPWR